MHGVRVLIAPDSFGSSLTADEASETIAGAWRAVAPDDEVLTCPLSEGGPGFVATLHRVPALRDRLFTPEEREMPETSLAARFAVKEAIAKALGAPPGMSWQDATVRRVAGAQPVVEVIGTVAAAAAAGFFGIWKLTTGVIYLLRPQSEDRSIEEIPG